MAHILVVEDREQDRYMLQVLLEGHGYAVTAAANGIEALQIATRNPPDLIVADLLMPGMDGFALCRQWRQDARLKDIPFVVYTATYTDVRDQEFALSLGADRCMIKPQEPDVFIQGLLKVLEEHRAGRLRAHPPAVQDMAYLQQHNEALNRKLGQKLAQVEVGKQALEEEAGARMRAEQQVKVFSQQLKNLAAHIESVREDERGSVGREIHDELGQHLTGLKITAFLLAREFSKPNITISRQDTVERIERMLKSIDAAIQTVRKISTLLRPTVLDDLGLLAAIEWHAQDFQARTGIRTRVRLPSQGVQLSPEATRALFRIIQESLTNVAQHAKASRVDIKLQQRKDLLWLSVSDNGQGIPEYKIEHPRSLGLLGMKERAILLGGDLSVSGKPAKGTTVTVKVPLQRAANVP